MYLERFKINQMNYKKQKLIPQEIYDKIEGRHVHYQCHICSDATARVDLWESWVLTSNTSYLEYKFYSNIRIKNKKSTTAQTQHEYVVFVQL